MKSPIPPSPSIPSIASSRPGDPVPPDHAVRSLEHETAELMVAWTPTAGSPMDALGQCWSGFERPGHTSRPIAAVPHVSRSLLRSRTVGLRRSGLHATVRPGMAVDGRRVDAGRDALSHVLLRCPPVTMPPLHLAWRDDQLHLVTDGEAPNWSELCRIVTEGLDHLRVPTAPDVRQAHRRRGLTLREELMLLRWGHPDASFDTPFEIRVTDAIGAAERRDFELAACSWFAPVMGHRWVIGELTLLRVDGVTGLHRTVGEAALGGSFARAVPA